MVPLNQSVEHGHAHVFDFLLLQLIQHPLDDLVIVPDVSLEDLRNPVLEVDQAREVLYPELLPSPLVRYLDQVEITFVQLLVNI